MFVLACACVCNRSLQYAAGEQPLLRQTEREEQSLHKRLPPLSNPIFVPQSNSDPPTSSTAGKNTRDVHFGSLLERLEREKKYAGIWTLAFVFSCVRNRKEIPPKRGGTTLFPIYLNLVNIKEDHFKSETQQKIRGRKNYFELK